MKTYSLKVAGLTRELPICAVSNTLDIAAFIMFGDVELTVNCAKELLARAPEHDIIITAEAKGIPLAYEMARQNGENGYLIARKGVKVYMRNPVSVSVKSITTTKMQTLYIDENDAEQMRGHRVLIVDDVISTGESLNAIEALVNKAGGTIVGRMAVLAEGDAQKRDNITFLAPLPVFVKN